MITEFYLNFKNKQGLFDILKSLDPTKLWRIRIDEYDAKTRLQEEKAHAMFGDIARQSKHLNQVFSADDWKRLLVAQFRIDSIASDIPRIKEYWIRNEFKLIPSLDGSSLVSLGQQTRVFPKYVYAALIDWLYSYGANNNIEWSEPKEKWDSRYSE